MNDMEKVKSKAQIKREIKEAKQHETRCLFCSKEFGGDIREMEKINRNTELNKPIPQAFLICVECMTGGELPADDDLKMIRKSGKQGGLLLTNHKKYPAGEAVLLHMIENALKLGNLKVYGEDKKVYMEADRGGITIELNIYRNNKNEDK